MNDVQARILLSATEQTKDDSRSNALLYIGEKINQANAYGIDGVALFNETGYYKLNLIGELSTDELNQRGQSMRWFLEGMDGWLAKRLAK